MANVSIDSKICEGCKACVLQCPTEVYEMQEGKAAVVASDDCMICHLCETICPTGAISVKD